MITPSQDQITVCYNGSCPVCRAEIAHYRAQPDAPDRLAFVDLAAADAEELPEGLRGDAGLRRLHALTPDGRLLAGVDAFLAVWERLGRYRWLARLIRRPWPRHLAGLVYDRLAAPVLFALHRRRQARLHARGQAASETGPAR